MKQYGNSQEGERFERELNGEVFFIPSSRKHYLTPPFLRRSRIKDGKWQTSFQSFTIYLIKTVVGIKFMSVFILLLARQMTIKLANNFNKICCKQDTFLR